MRTVERPQTAEKMLVIRRAVAGVGRRHRHAVPERHRYRRWLWPDVADSNWIDRTARAGLRAHAAAVHMRQFADLVGDGSMVRVPGGADDLERRDRLPGRGGAAAGGVPDRQLGTLTGDVSLHIGQVAWKRTSKDTVISSEAEKSQCERQSRHLETRTSPIVIS